MILDVVASWMIVFWRNSREAVATKDLSWTERTESAMRSSLVEVNTFDGIILESHLAGEHGANISSLRESERHQSKAREEGGGKRAHLNRISAFEA